MDNVSLLLQSSIVAVIKVKRGLMRHSSGGVCIIVIDRISE